MKIICAFDSFKGCLSSSEAGLSAAKGINVAIPEAEVKIVACADGGEGMSEAVLYAGIGRKISMNTVDSLGRRIMADYTFDDETTTAFIDLAAASGLTLLSADERSPEQTSTYGTGLMIRHALQHGAKKIMLGLGGSATNDAGLGALQALGVKFYDKTGHEIPMPITGSQLHIIKRVDLTELSATLRGSSISLLCDVDNPFVGPRGAVAVFARQKGADASMLLRLEDGMRNIAEVIKNNGFTDIFLLSGAGAAGGAAGGFATLAGGKIMAGAETLLKIIGMDSLLADADLVITGEGSSDAQTLCGKLPVTVLRYAQDKKVPCWLLSGKIREEERLLQAGFDKVICINTPMKSDETDLFSLDKNYLQPEIASARLTTTIKNLID